MAVISGSSRAKPSWRVRHRVKQHGMAMLGSWTRRQRVLLVVVVACLALPWISCLIFVLGFPTEAYQTYDYLHDVLSFHYLQPYLQRYTSLDWTMFQADYQQRFGQAPPASLQAWHEYAKFHGCSETEGYQWMQHDLETFQSQIKSTGRLFSYSKIVESGIQQTDNYVVFQLQQHELTVIATQHKFDAASFNVIVANYHWMLRPVVLHVPPLFMVLFFDLHDHPTTQSTLTSLPMFSTCRMNYWTDDQPIPSEQELLSKKNSPLRNQRAALQQQQQQVSEGKLIHPDYKSYDSRTLLVPYYWALDVSMFRHGGPAFAKRNNAIVWRGVTTGYDWGKSPRFQLVLEYGGRYQPYILPPPAAPVQMDFAFVNIVQNFSTTDTLPPGTRMAPSMSDTETQHYKYMIDVDGNAFTSRFPRLLQSGSLLFKSTRYREWYTERVQPFVHYVPVNYNLSDLVDKITWAHDHPLAAEQIVTQGNERSRQFFSRQEIKCYLYRLILEYDELFEHV